jgi:hypothetical protein
MPLPLEASADGSSLCTVLLAVAYARTDDEGRPKSTTGTSDQTWGRTSHKAGTQTKKIWTTPASGDGYRLVVDGGSIERDDANCCVRYFIGKVRLFT